MKRKKTPALKPALFVDPVYLATITVSKIKLIKQPINPITERRGKILLAILCTGVNVMLLTEQLDPSHTVNQNRRNVISCAGHANI
jgi:hypothetical protein